MALNLGWHRSLNLRAGPWAELGWGGVGWGGRSKVPVGVCEVTVTNGCGYGCGESAPKFWNILRQRQGDDRERGQTEKHTMCLGWGCTHVSMCMHVCTCELRLCITLRVRHKTSQTRREIHNHMLLIYCGVRWALGGLGPGQTPLLHKLP